jgi:hypothetical protein
LKTWLQEQSQRKAMLENLLANYNEGRSCSFFCVATALMPVDLVKKGEKEARRKIADEKIQGDIKAKAKVVRSVIQDFASQADIDLKLRKKPK